jgi:mannuronan synthase
MTPYTTAKKEPTVSAPTPVVHESSSQRQHPRVRLPGVVEITSARGGARFKLYDVSAGGFCLETGGQAFRPGESHRGNLIVNVDGVAITLAVAFQVRSVANGRAGCCFQELGAQEISVLRHLIHSHLSGDVVSVGEVLHTLGRDNFTRARPAAPPRPPARTGSRMRALLTTALFLGAAVVAFGYTARQVNRVLFASTATAAKVAGPVYSVVMPREGTFWSLVPDDGVVKRGAPIASFEAPVLDLVRSQALGANLTPEQLQKLIKVTVKGTITSPCDCRVQTQFVANGQYVAKEQPLFELMPRDFEPYLVARFRNDQLGDLATGDRVSFRVSGESRQRVGTITQVRAHGRGDTVDTDVMVMVEPEEPLPAELLSRPAEVIAGGFPLLPDVVPGLTATARERTP